MWFDQRVADWEVERDDGLSVEQQRLGLCHQPEATPGIRRSTRLVEQGVVVRIAIADDIKVRGIAAEIGEIGPRVGIVRNPAKEAQLLVSLVQILVQHAPFG